MKKIDGLNIIKSGLLGLFIGFVMQVSQNRGSSLEVWLYALLLSSLIGTIIGFITEGFTAMIPIRLANTKMYFIINNIIALVITSLVLITLNHFVFRALSGVWDWMKLLATVLSIVTIANFVDYQVYKKSQRKLNDYKESL
jgi:hypothetical protein